MMVKIVLGHVKLHRTTLFILRHLKQPMNSVVSAALLGSSVMTLKIDKNIFVDTRHQPSFQATNAPPYS